MGGAADVWDIGESGRDGATHRCPESEMGRGGWGRMGGGSGVVGSGGEGRGGKRNTVLQLTVNIRKKESIRTYHKFSFSKSSSKIINLYTPPYGGGGFMRIPRRNAMGVATTQAPGPRVPESKATA